MSNQKCLDQTAGAGFARADDRGNDGIARGFWSRLTDAARNDPWNPAMRGQSLRRRALCLALVAASVAPISLTIFSSRASGAATTWYASVAGSGTTCTTSSPCALTEALSSATFGDTVDLAPGTYEPATSFTISTSITLQPTTPGTSVILTGNDATVLIVDPSVVATISGISIENGTSYAGGRRHR